MIDYRDLATVDPPVDFGLDARYPILLPMTPWPAGLATHLMPG